MTDCLSQILPLIINFGILIVMIIGVWIASKGLKTWKDQLKGSSEFQIAKKMIALIRKLSDRINVLRRSFVIRRAVESNIPREIDSNINLYFRYIEEILDEINIELVEAELFWEDNIRSLISKLFKHYFDYHEALIDLQHGKIMEPDQLNNRNRILCKQDNNDSYKKHLDVIIKEIEDFLKPKLITNVK